MRRAIGSAAALAAWLAPAAAQPVTVRDALDRSVTVPAPPQRIVTIFASNTEMVAALGLAERIVGIEAYTRYPPEVIGKPLVGGRLGFSVDAVVAQRPDLVVITPARQAVHQLVDPLQRVGVPVVVLQHRSIAEVVANIRLLGRVAGASERAEAVAAGLEHRLAGIARQVGGKAPARAVMITGRLGNGLLLVARPGTYTGDALELAGARFAIATPVPQVSPEAILGADPDTLLYAGSEADLAELVARPGWSDLRAVKARRAHAVRRTEWLIPGPRTIDGIERLAALLHPVTAP